jgi:HPt (histidine-containing phosphotransfer) domain-containing protein
MAGTTVGDVRLRAELRMPEADTPGAEGDPVLDPAAVADLLMLHEEDECGRAAVAEIIATFVQTTPARLAALDRAAAAHDGQALAYGAHCLRGASGAFGATGMAWLCQELERRARLGDMGAGAGLLGQLRDEFGRVAGALERLAARLRGESPHG